jgi:hypothetical protein
VRPGDHFWHIANVVIADAWGRVPTTTETARFWAALVAANVDRLVDRDNADFILPGQEFVVPPPPPPPAAPG